MVKNYYFFWCEITKNSRYVRTVRKQIIKDQKLFLIFAFSRRLLVEPFSLIWRTALIFQFHEQHGYRELARTLCQENINGQRKILFSRKVWLSPTTSYLAYLSRQLLLFITRFSYHRAETHIFIQKCCGGIWKVSLPQSRLLWISFYSCFQSLMTNPRTLHVICWREGSRWGRVEKRGKSSTRFQLVISILRQLIHPNYWSIVIWCRLRLLYSFKSTWMKTVLNLSTRLNNSAIIAFFHKRNLQPPPVSTGLTSIY